MWGRGKGEGRGEEEDFGYFLNQDLIIAVL